jgi:DNA-directed RNA polymerase subunit M/transcription elongation factor TFIIS
MIYIFIIKENYKMSIEFDDSEIIDSDTEETINESDNEEEETIEIDNEEEETIEIDNEEEDEEDITFDSDEECDKEEIGECDDTTVEGIDPIEFYEETPKKTSKAVFNKRKRIKPPKVSIVIKKKKKRTDDDNEIIIQNYMVGNIRERLVLQLKNIDEKNCKLIERSIFNSVIRKTEGEFNRKLKKSDLDLEIFRTNYISVAYETFVSISNGLSYEEQIIRLNDNKINLNSVEFKNEMFIDIQETKNIEEPPKIMSGIDVCGKCYKDKDKKHDPERGTHTTYYELQTRSQDEPMTRFVECIDCGTKWKS